MNTEKIDRAIDAVAEYIENNANGCCEDKIKALAELVTARALVEQIHYLANLDLSTGLNGKQINQIVKKATHDIASV